MTRLSMGMDRETPPLIGVSPVLVPLTVGNAPDKLAKEYERTAGARACASPPRRSVQPRSRKQILPGPHDPLDNPHRRCASRVCPLHGETRTITNIRPCLRVPARLSAFQPGLQCRNSPLLLPEVPKTIYSLGPSRTAHRANGIPDFFV
jgi:hypothetical protein